MYIYETVHRGVVWMGGNRIALTTSKEHGAMMRLTRIMFTKLEHSFEHLTNLFK